MNIDIETRTNIFFIICLVCGLYFVVKLSQQLTKTWSRNQKIAYAKQQLVEANKTTNFAKENLLNEISKQFDNEITKKVSQGIIWNGMPDFLLIAALGKAHDIKQTFFRGLTTEKWYYGSYRNRLGNIKYNLEVIVENSKIIGWKDLY